MGLHLGIRLIEYLMLSFPLPQGDSDIQELRGRFMVKNQKSLSKVKKTRVLTEKGCFLLLQEIRVCAYLGLNVTLTAVRRVFGSFFNPY